MALTTLPRIRVLIVDDHAMVRRGMRDFLDLHDDLEVVGEAADGNGALEPRPALLPDVVVMDLLMPGLDGIAATAELKARHPAIEVVAITSFIEEDRITAALEAGRERLPAQGCRGRRPGRCHPLRARRRGLPRSGGRRDRRSADADRTAGRPRAKAPATAALARLTGRERDVLACVARGLSNRAIATELGMAERTARTHVSNILAKLGLTSRTQAALFAVEHGSTGP